jgi:hypothetical protein
MSTPEDSLGRSLFLGEIEDSGWHHFTFRRRAAGRGFST